MTVSELIKHLENLPSDAEIRIYESNGSDKKIKSIVKTGDILVIVSDEHPGLYPKRAVNNDTP